LVQGIIDAFREKNPFGNDYQVEFTQTIPAGKDFCRFVINEKKSGEPDKWETYSKLLERKAMNRLKKRKKEQ